MAVIKGLYILCILTPNRHHLLYIYTIDIKNQDICSIFIDCIQKTDMQAVPAP